jgi:SAM-dependent methyltransferase
MSSRSSFRIDLGCGSNKKEGTLGVDILAGPGVDYVLDLATSPLPFEDRTVSYVHSSHLIEHLADPGQLFLEVSRVSLDGAELEFWTPYAWSNSAFVLGHKTFLAEDIYLHFEWYSDFWRPILGAYWILREFRYVIKPETLCYLHQKNISVDFAVRHLKDVVFEFCMFANIERKVEKPAFPPIRRTFSTGRFDQAHVIKEDMPDRTVVPELLAKAISANTAR